MAASIVLLLLMASLGYYCNRPECRDFVSCVVWSNGGDDSTIMEQCGTEFFTIQSFDVMCNYFGSEGNLAPVCKNKELVKMLVKHGTHYAFTRDDKKKLQIT